MKIMFLFDQVGERELQQGKLRADSQTVRLFRYLCLTVRKTLPAAEFRMVIASPQGLKATAKGYKDYAPTVQKEIIDFGADLIVISGKSALYAIESWLPKDFPKTLKFQRLFGRQVALNQHRGNAVFVPSTRMLYASKEQEGGYLYLRTFIESVGGAIGEGGGTPIVSNIVHVTGSDAAEAILVERLQAAPKGFSAKLRRNRAEQGDSSALDLVGLDTETTGLNVAADKVRTIQLSFEDGQAYVYNYGALSPERWSSYLEQLYNAGYRFVMQNGKFDWKILKSNGTTVPPYYELSSAHVVVDERPWTHNLNDMGLQILGEGKNDISKQALITGDIDDDFLQYAGKDADITRRAFLHLYPAVYNKPAFQILSRAAMALAAGEATGILIDAPKLYQMKDEAETQIREYQRMFDKHELNPLSVPQVRAKLGIAESDKKALEDVDSELARAIIEFRSLTKFRNSYLLRIEAAIQADGRFRPDIRLAGPVTGRTSSGSGSVQKGLEYLPINSQNIPRPQLSGQGSMTLSERLKGQLRSLFIAGEGYKLIGVDGAAAEMRMAANHCLDQTMIDDLNRKVDTHSLLTIMALGLDIEIDLENPDSWVKHIKKNYEFQRQSTKNATFATLYGGGLSAIAAQAKCDVETARLLQSTIYTRYPGLKTWIDNVHRRIQKEGVAETRYGRRRIFPYNTGLFDNQMQQSMLREGQNYIIQGDASDYGLLAMATFHEQHGYKWPTVNFVHDAIYALAPEDDAEEAKVAIVEAWENADTSLPAKMYGDGKYADNWGQL